MVYLRLVVNLSKYSLAWSLPNLSILVFIWTFSQSYVFFLSVFPIDSGTDLFTYSLTHRQSMVYLHLVTYSCGYIFIPNSFVGVPTHSFTCGVEHFFVRSSIYLCRYLCNCFSHQYIGYDGSDALHPYPRCWIARHSIFIARLLLPLWDSPAPTAPSQLAETHVVKLNISTTAVVEYEFQ